MTEGNFNQSPTAFLQARLRFRGLKTRVRRRYQLWAANKANKAIIDIHNQGENTSLKLEPRGLKEGSDAIPCNRPHTSSPVLLLTLMIRMYCTHKIKSFFVLQTFWTPAIHAFVITLEHSYRALKSIFNGQWMTWLSKPYPAKPQLLKKWNSHSRCNFTPLFQYLITFATMIVISE